MNNILATACHMLYRFSGIQQSGNSNTMTDLNTLHNNSIHKDSAMYESIWLEQTNYKDDFHVKRTALCLVSLDGRTRLYGGSWDLNIEHKKRSIDERYVPSEKRMRKSNALTPCAIIDKVLKIILAEKRRSILIRTLELSKEYADKLAAHTPPPLCFLLICSTHHLVSSDTSCSLLKIARVKMDTMR
jgi:hypothetical protein